MHRTMIRGARIVAVCLGAFLLLKLWGMGYFRTSHAAVRAFVRQEDVHESRLQDPLLAVGRRAVPLVAERIGDREMPLRIYAMSYLGNVLDPRGVPALERIARDPTEREYHRYCALISLARIDDDSARECARQNAGAEGIVGDLSRDILIGAPIVFPDRTFWDVWTARME